jgi:hypothetical protein
MKVCEDEGENEEECSLPEANYPAQSDLIRPKKIMKMTRSPKSKVQGPECGNPDINAGAGCRNQTY